MCVARCTEIARSCSKNTVCLYSIIRSDIGAIRPRFRLPGTGHGRHRGMGTEERVLLGRSTRLDDLSVFVDGMWQYELWFSRGDGGTIYGMRASLAAAQELFNQKLR